MRVRRMASELNSTEIISRIFANDSVIIVATARQSLLAFTIVLPRSTSSKIPGNAEADDGLR